jgi:hypothetical protein
MKSRLLLLGAIAFAASVPSIAQIAVGPKAGINFNSFRGNDQYDVIPGFNVGGFAKYPIFDFLSARAELLYTVQGANLYDYRIITPDLQRNNAKVKFHNLQIPVMAEFGLPALSEDDVKPKLWLGGFYTTNIYARETYTNVARVTGYNPIEYSGHSNVKHLFKKSQYGLMAGIGGDIKVYSYPVSLEFRYQYHLNRINKPGTQSAFNLSNTHEEWGDRLYLATLSINVAVTLFYF